MVKFNRGRLRQLLKDNSIQLTSIFLANVAGETVLAVPETAGAFSRAKRYDRISQNAVRLYGLQSAAWKGTRKLKATDIDFDATYDFRRELARPFLRVDRQDETTTTANVPPRNHPMKTRKLIRENVRLRLAEAKKKIAGNLCVNTGQGSGGGFVPCNQGGATATADRPSMSKETQARAAELAKSKFPVIAQHADLIARVEEKITAQLAKGDTEAQFTDGHGNYTPERQKVHEQVLREIFNKDARPAPGEKPLLVLMGGLPGSGKSTASEGLSTDNKIVVDPDQIKALLGKHGKPPFTGGNAAVLHNESGYLGQLATKMALDNGLNLVVDATMRSERGTMEHITNARKSGHRVEIRFVDVTLDTSITRAMSRFTEVEKKHGTGRYVPLSYIQSLARQAPPPKGAKFTSENRQTFERVKNHVDAYLIVDNNGGFGQQKVIAKKGRVSP